jgi:hypothetical protein
MIARQYKRAFGRDIFSAEYAKAKKKNTKNPASPTSKPVPGWPETNFFRYRSFDFAQDKLTLFYNCPATARRFAETSQFFLTV